MLHSTHGKNLEINNYIDLYIIEYFTKSSILNTLGQQRLCRDRHLVNVQSVLWKIKSIEFVSLYKVTINSVV